MIPKKGFLLYCDQLDFVNDLSMEQKGFLLTAIYNYACFGTVDDIQDLTTKVVFKIIKSSIERDTQKYNKKCECNRINGLHGGRPKKQKVETETQQNPKEPNGLNEKPSEPKKPDIDKDKEIDKDTKKEFFLPDWLLRESFDAFIEMRKKVKAPLTDKARDMLIGKLEEFRGKGYDPNLILNESTMNNWKGVFEPKTKPTFHNTFKEKSLEELVS